MFRGPALPCPACRRTYEAIDWIDAEHCRCLRCREDFDFISFPALSAKSEVVRPQAITFAEDSSCFFHAENQAEKLCDDCGRFLCHVCAVPMSGRTLCPTCIASAKKNDVQLVTSRVVPGGAALLLAVLPILMWPITCITAPAALYLAITGWKKPQSLVKPRRWKLLVAGLIASLQIIGWCVVVGGLFLNSATL